MWWKSVRVWGYRLGSGSRLMAGSAVLCVRYNFIDENQYMYELITLKPHLWEKMFFFIIIIYCTYYMIFLRFLSSNVYTTIWCTYIYIYIPRNIFYWILCSYSFSFLFRWIETLCVLFAVHFLQFENDVDNSSGSRMLMLYYTYIHVEYQDEAALYTEHWSEKLYKQAQYHWIQNNSMRYDRIPSYSILVSVP